MQVSELQDSTLLEYTFLEKLFFTVLVPLFFKEECTFNMAKELQRRKCHQNNKTFPTPLLPLLQPQMSPLRQGAESLPGEQRTRGKPPPVATWIPGSCHSWCHTLACGLGGVWSSAGCTALDLVPCSTYAPFSQGRS